tara:strand:+ start:649 stop:828 length:180 start_codon:yes stop_codon:yes gene_type:complete
MITLTNGIQVEVNESQYRMIQANYSWSCKYRKQDGKFFIKPIIFYGYKKVIEQKLNNLN